MINIIKEKFRPSNHTLVTIRDIKAPLEFEFLSVDVVNTYMYFDLQNKKFPTKMLLENFLFMISF